jgi:hypothetical protein
MAQFAELMLPIHTIAIALVVFLLCPSGVIYVDPEPDLYSSPNPLFCAAGQRCCDLRA